MVDLDHMLYSGADLIRTGKQHVEKQERLKVVPSVKPAETAKPSSSSLDEETRGALLRLARFMGKEKKREKSSRKPPQRHPYRQHIERFENPEPRGQTFDRIA